MGLRAVRDLLRDLPGHDLPRHRVPRNPLAIDAASASAKCLHEAHEAAAIFRVRSSLSPVQALPSPRQSKAGWREVRDPVATRATTVAARRQSIQRRGSIRCSA
jgi:hypothetical protein